MPEMSADSDETAALLERIRGGDESALSRLLAHWRPRLVRFVSLRLGGKLRTRVDPSDIVQEAQLEVVRRIDDFLRRRPMPFHLWLRKTAYERLLNLRRDHHRERRSLEREELLRALGAAVDLLLQEADEVRELASKLTAQLWSLAAMWRLPR